VKASSEEKSNERINITPKQTNQYRRKSKFTFEEERQDADVGKKVVQEQYLEANVGKEVSHEESSLDANVAKKVSHEESSLDAKVAKKDSHEESSLDASVTKEVSLKESSKEENVVKEVTEERSSLDVTVQDISQESMEDLEHLILHSEIERIHQKLQSGFEEEERVTLTSKFNNEAEISQTMHFKLMRLIKALMPNSTLEQKDSFIRDLFEMGIRVSRSSSTRLQIEQDFGIAKQGTQQRPVEESITLETNSILESVTGHNKDVIRQRPNVAVSYTTEDYMDGTNSIIESQSESRPGVEMASSLNQSLSSRRDITTQATNSSDEVDARWEQLRDKMLNESKSKSESERTVTLSSEMEASLIRGCVETGLDEGSQQQDPITEKQSSAIQQRDGSQATVVDGSTSLRRIMNDMHQIKIGIIPSQTDVRTPRMENRRGQADASVVSQPLQQRNNVSDSFSIDATSFSIAKEQSHPSFDEGPTKIERNVAPVQSLRSKDPIGSLRSQDPIESLRSHEISLHPSLKDQLDIRVSESSFMENSKITTDFNSIVDDSRSTRSNVAKLIYVKSSLTAGTDIPSIKEAERSFYRTVNLSASEMWKDTESTESPKSTTKLPSSWRSSPSESLSDFMLTVLSAEKGTATNYYVHKHMMAIGPRSSKYMAEVFASENTSNFQVTLDERTAVLIPEILDFIYNGDFEVNVTTENVVALRQLAKMLKVIPLEVKAVNYILEDMRVDNLVTYVSDCCYFNDIEVTKTVVERCTENIGSIPMNDRLWVVMEPELFLQIVSSAFINRNALSTHLSILLREYLDLHQYEIEVDLFVTLTSESIIPIVDRTVALPLIELSTCYDSGQCEELLKRCCFTIACYWQTTPQSDRHRLFALLRHLPSALTVDFLEVVESGHVTLEMLRSEMEQQTTSGGKLYTGNSQDSMTVQHFLGDVVGEDCKNNTLTWRMDPSKSYSDMCIQVKYLNHQGSQDYYLHKHIVATGPKRSKFIAENLHSDHIPAGEEVCIVVELDYEGASIVPQMLDFMYLEDYDLEISNENAVVFHYVSRTFGISALSKKIMKFIEQDVSLHNLADYIIDGGYYRDQMAIATAGRLCARNILSIDVESNLLTELEPDFFEKIVSCDAIEERARPHVNVLITKYFLIRKLEGDVIERLLKSIYVDQIEKHSALYLLKMATNLREYEGVETFENMKEKSLDVIIEHWTEMTADKDCREELFSLLPSFSSERVAIMFDTVDSNTREEHRAALSQKDTLVKHCQDQVTETNRLREEEVSNLKKDLEARTARMLELQRELEGNLTLVDKALELPCSPVGNKTNDFCENGSAVLKQQLEGAWCNDCIKGNRDAEKEAEGTDKADVTRESKTQDAEINNSDQQSVTTIQVQKKKGGISCW
jgi:hypothetical protein